MSLADLGITSDAQLHQLAKRMGLPKIQYIGFAEDMHFLPEGLSIINLGGEYQGGTHWTMLWTTPSQVAYFDSYGVGPEDNIIRLAGDRDLTYNTKQVQRYDEEHCGVWVLLAAKTIIDSKKNGIDAPEAIDAFANKFDAV